MAAEVAATVAPRKKAAFTKMQGLGNDFVVLDVSALSHPPSASTIRRLADRRRGIGCDQLLLLETGHAPFRYRVFNADGVEVEQCGNGARCLARHLFDQGVAASGELQLDSPAGLIRARTSGDAISISLGVPRFAPADLPFEAQAEAPVYAIDVDGRQLEIGALSVGNPHAIVEVASVDEAPVAHLGPLLEHHSRFPRRVNVGFVEIVDRERCRLRVFERGVGETPACGTGAAAAVVWGRMMTRLDSRVTVGLTGGELTVEWPGREEPVWLTGPATPVFEGSIAL